MTEEMMTMSRLFTTKQIERAVGRADHRCPYCDLPYGTVVMRRGRGEVVQTPTGDHFVPHAWSRQVDEGNLVACCQVCNQLKNDLIFPTVAEAWRYISQRRVVKGYQVVWVPEVALTQDAAAWSAAYGRLLMGEPDD